MGNRTWTGGMRGARRKVECWEGGSHKAFCHTIRNEQPLNFS